MGSKYVWVGLDRWWVFFSQIFKLWTFILFLTSTIHVHWHVMQFIVYILVSKIISLYLLRCIFIYAYFMFFFFFFLVIINYYTDFTLMLDMICITSWNVLSLIFLDNQWTSLILVMVTWSGCLSLPQIGGEGYRSHISRQVAWQKNTNIKMHTPDS